MPISDHANGTAKSSTGWVLALTSVASLMVALDLLVVSTALPTIRLDLGAPIEQLQWTVTAYGLTFAVLLMAGAALGDRFGRRRVFMIGLALFAVASAGCALSPDVGWLIAARAVQGAGAALVLPLAVALLSASVAAARRGRALGIFEGITGLATIAGPPVGGIVAQTFGWEWIFWINVPIALVTIPLVARRIEESHGTDTRLDLRGLALVTCGAFGLVWGLVRGNTVGWSSPGIIAVLTAGVLLMIAFVVVETRTREPMLPMRLFRSRGFAAGTTTSFFLFAALYGSVFFLAQFMQTGLGYTPAEAGLRLIPWTATLLVIAPLAGLLADRFGDRPILVGGTVLQAAGLAWLAMITAPDLAYSALVPPLIVAGIGASMAIPVVQNVVIGAVAPDAVGKASGANNATQELGGVFGVAILVAAFTAAGSYASAPEFVDGFTIAIGTCAALAVAAGIAALATPPRDTTPSTNPPRPTRPTRPGTPEGAPRAR